MIFFNNKKAFTLAEVLLTLVIIGVVAAITLPVISENYQKQITIEQLKKAYSAFSQITNRAIADNGPIESWIIDDDSNNSNIFFHKNYIIPYLNIMKDCGYSNNMGCNFQYKTFKGKKNNLNYMYRFILNDGTLVASSISVTNSVKYIRVFIDVNGEKSPNIMGRDVFAFIYYIHTIGNKLKGIFVPECHLINRKSILTDSWGCNKKSDGLYSGICCAELIMQDGWQIKKDYPW